MTQTSRRLFTAALLLTPALAPALARAATSRLSAEDQALVDRAVAYLEGLSRAQGKFVQTDARGKRAPGTFYLQRPGKMRFEYDPPNDNLLMVSDGYQVEMRDSKLKGVPQRWPLRATPLSLFLAKDIRLDRGVVVTKVERGQGQFSITARDGGKDAAGQVVLVFGDDPVTLREWTTTDATRQTTRVQLTSIKPVGSLDPSLFQVLAGPPKPKAG